MTANMLEFLSRSKTVEKMVLRLNSKDTIAILLINANSRCAEPPFAIVRTYCF